MYTQDKGLHRATDFHSNLVPTHKFVVGPTHSGKFITEFFKPDFYRFSCRISKLTFKCMFNR